MEPLNRGFLVEQLPKRVRQWQEGDGNEEVGEDTPGVWQCNSPRSDYLEEAEAQYGKVGSNRGNEEYWEPVEFAAEGNADQVEGEGRYERGFEEANV